MASDNLHMASDYLHKLWIYALSMLALIGFTIYLFATKGFDLEWMLMVAIVSVPALAIIGVECMKYLSNPVRRLHSVLPKCGFEIESMKWNDDQTSATFVGKYKEDFFAIDASTATQLIDIINLPWSQFNVKDDCNDRVMECINEVNSHRTQSRVVVSDPDESGNRQIMTVCTTILPQFFAKAFVSSTLTQMLGRKSILTESYRADNKPWLHRHRWGLFNIPYEQN